MPARMFPLPAPEPDRPTYTYLKVTTIGEAREFRAGNRLQYPNNSRLGYWIIDGRLVVVKWNEEGRIEDEVIFAHGAWLSIER